jgi:hypothetical protein
MTTRLMVSGERIMEAISKMTSRKTVVRLAIVVFVLTFLLAVPNATMSAQESRQKTFASPQEAGSALYEAVKSDDKAATLAVLGSSASSIISSGDEVQDKNNRGIFVKHYEQMHRWATSQAGNQILFIGADNWPFPVPLKKDSAGKWYFDTKDGVQEILFRRIGKNELITIHVCETLAKAQHEYFEQLHDSDTVHQYAQRFLSESGKQNGLYWPVSEGQPESPIGPLVARATKQGYGQSSGSPEPFHGYFYRILKGQGANAPGAAKSYIVDGKMTGGFAFLAYPAEYRNSGVMTFLVDQNGIVYQKDLGPKTDDIAKDMTTYNPDKTWVVANADGEPDE